MNNIFVYQSLYLKRNIKIVPFVLAVIVAVCAVLYLLSENIIQKKLSGEEYTRFTIGIVGNTEDTYLGWGIDALRTFDSSRFTLDFQDMTESEAYSKLKNREIYAYIRIPEDFISSAARGDIKNIEYVTESAPAGISAIVKDEVLNTISEIVKYTEKGIYGGYHAMNENGVQDVSGKTDILAVRYLGFVMNRAGIYEIEPLGVSDSLPFTLYYICGFITLFICISGTALCTLFSCDNTSFHRMMHAKGMGSVMQTAAEYSAYLITLLITVMPVIAAALLMLHISGTVSQFSSLSASELAEFVACAAVGALCICALQFLIYEAVSGIINQIIIQFAGFTGLCYICGCFYPISFFPQSVQVISGLLPVGIVREYLAACLAGRHEPALVLGILAYTVIFISLSALIRKSRITGIYGEAR